MKTIFCAGVNMCGYMPDSEPFETTDFDQAKRYIIDYIKNEEEDQETEEEAEELCALAEYVNLESDEFTAICLGKAYWVTKL